MAIGKKERKKDSALIIDNITRGKGKKKIFREFNSFGYDRIVSFSVKHNWHIFLILQYGFAGKFG